MRKLWRCTVCGYIHEGGEAPDVCPKCGALREKFTQLASEDAEKILMSERTNDIHMEIIMLADRIQRLAKEGIELKLDPPCVALFKSAQEKSIIIKQSCKAELEGHMKKGKW